MKYFFTADEHYGHSNIIGYCDRPFATVEKMDEELIKRHNEVVGSEEVVFHLGDFTMKDSSEAEKYIKQLNGKPVFIKGSHDENWMEKNLFHTYNEIWEGEIENHYIVLCHYAMRIWPRSHYNSWQLYGHSHGKFAGTGKQMDVGVDTHNFYPYSLEEIEEIMKTKKDNINKLK